MTQLQKNNLPIIKNFSVDEFAAELEYAGFERYRTEQILTWIYARGVTDWDAMTNLSKSGRVELESLFRVGILDPARVQISSDGARKYLFELEDGLKIESVLIPDGRRVTLCVSTQVGCALACKFCFTGMMGFIRNLQQWEILEQVLAVRRDRPPEEWPTNVVFMGMGEPLMNYENVMRAVRIMMLDYGLNLSPRRITLSTAGIPDKIEKLAGERPQISIALSLNAPDNELRTKLMPVNKRHSIEDVFSALKKFPLTNRRRITFEYIMLKGKNDDELSARRLANLVKRFPCKVNLIPFNPYPGAFLEPSSMRDIEVFQEILKSKNISAFIRRSRGSDILAACGQLAVRE